MNTLIIRKLIQLLSKKEEVFVFPIKDKEYRIRITEYETYFQFIISILLDNLYDMSNALLFPLSGMRFRISPDSHHNTPSVLYFSNKEDIFDVLNSDDLSLVLKHGREILDENMLKRFKYENIELKDLENFLNL